MQRFEKFKFQTGPRTNAWTGNQFRKRIMHSPIADFTSETMETNTSKQFLYVRALCFRVHVSANLQTKIPIFRQKLKKPP